MPELCDQALAVSGNQIGVFRSGIIDKAVMYEAAWQRSCMIDLYGYCISIWYWEIFASCQAGVCQENDLRLAKNPYCRILTKSFGKQCIALFVALSFNLDRHSFAVDVFGFEVNGFTGPEPCRVGGHQDKAMLEVVRGTDDLPDFFHCQDLWKFSHRPADAVGDGYLIFGHVFIKKANTSKNAVAAIGCIALVMLKIEKIILYFFFGQLIRRLIIEPGDPCDIGKVCLLCVIGEILKFHSPDHFLT